MNGRARYLAGFLAMVAGLSLASGCLDPTQDAEASNAGDDKAAKEVNLTVLTEAGFNPPGVGWFNDVFNPPTVADMVDDLIAELQPGQTIGRLLLNAHGTPGSIALTLNEPLTAQADAAFAQLARLRPYMAPNGHVVVVSCSAGLGFTGFYLGARMARAFGVDVHLAAGLQMSTRWGNVIPNLDGDYHIFATEARGEGKVLVRDVWQNAFWTQSGAHAFMKDFVDLEDSDDLEDLLAAPTAVVGIYVLNHYWELLERYGASHGDLADLWLRAMTISDDRETAIDLSDVFRTRNLLPICNYLTDGNLQGPPVTRYDPLVLEQIYLYGSPERKAYLRDYCRDGVADLRTGAFYNVVP